MKTPVRVTITGAAGQIGYQLAFRIASGQMLGPDQPVILQMLEIPPALPALQGVMMELDDCAFSTLAGLVGTDDPNVAFKDSDYAFSSVHVRVGRAWSVKICSKLMLQFFLFRARLSTTTPAATSECWSLVIQPTQMH